MSERFLDYDPFNGVRTDFIYDESEKKIRYAHTQNVNPILDYCKQKRANDDGGVKARNAARNDGYFHYATVPVTVISEWLHKYGVDAHNPDHIKYVDRLLSTDYKYLLTVDKI